MKKIINFIENHEKIIFGLILLFFCVFFFSSYFFTTFPISQGWGEHYSNLLSSGKVPYRDFYYYLPPYNLIFDWVLWKLSFGHIMIYSLYRFLERLIMIYLVYHLLCKLIKPRYACFGTCIGTAMFGAAIYDIIGDYNQSTLLLTVILTLIYTNFVKNINSENYSKKNYNLLYWGGFVIGLSFLLKQPLFLAESIIFFPLITFVFIREHKKNYLKSLLISIAGIMTPILITCIILYLNGALLPFINQVYLVESNKGSLMQIISVLARVCINNKALILTAFATLFFYIRYLYNKGDKRIKFSNIILSLLFLITIIYVLNTSELDSMNQLAFSKIGILGVIGILSIFFLERNLSKKGKDNDILIYTLKIAFIGMLMSVLVIKSGVAHIIYACTRSFSFLKIICTLFTTGCVCTTIYMLYKYFKSDSKKQKEYYLLWIFVFAGAIVYEYNMQMGSNSIHPVGCIIIIAAMICFILQKMGTKDLLIKYLLFTLSAFICVTVMAQKIDNAYSWWGDSEDRLTKNKLNTINVPGLEGYRTSKRKKQLFEKMYKVIKENTDENSVIYGFPYVEIFNVALNNTNLNTFVPIPFYDVCPDKYAREDAKRLSENPPEIVVWLDIPDCLETHEAFYKKGQKLGQRKIMKWFATEVKNKKYVLIGQYDNIFVYKLDDGSEIKYKYIKNKKTKNKTLNQFIKKKKKKTTKEKEDE